MLKQCCQLNNIQFKNSYFSLKSFTTFTFFVPFKKAGMVVSTGLCSALHIAYILLLAQELKLAIFCSKQCAQHWHWPPPARARVNFSVQCVQGFNLTYIITVCGTQDKYWATSCKNVHLLQYK